MKRLIILLLASILFVGVSNAQFSFGIKGGVNSASITADELYSIENQADLDTLIVKGQNAKVGFHAGVFARLSIKKLYIQPELLFTSVGGEVEVTTINSGNIEQTLKDQDFRRIDIPIMVGLHLGPVRIQGGPVGTIILDSEPVLQDIVETIDIEEEFNGATWGYQVGLGVDILKKVTVDVRYEGNLSSLGNAVDLGGESFDLDTRANQFIVSLGIIF